jgi:hypothetical protein
MGTMTSSLESAATRQSLPSRGARVALTVIGGFVALTAVGGGIALATGAEGDRFPADLLAGTPFRSYLIPGLILAVVVGGSAAVATTATLRSPEAGARASLLAGVILMGWIVGEIVILRAPAVRLTRPSIAVPSWVEAVYFALGLVLVVLGVTIGRSEIRGSDFG